LSQPSGHSTKRAGRRGCSGTLARLRILTVLDYYSPHWTGLTANARNIAEGLARRGHDVTVLTVHHDPSSPPESTEHGVRVVRVRPVGSFSRGLIAPGFPAAAARLIGSHDVVHLHTPMLQALPVAVLARARGRPLVMTHQGDIVMPAGLANRVVERTGNAMLAGAARLATGVTTFTRDYAVHSPLLRPVLGKLTALYPPISMPVPNPERVAALRASLGAGPVVGFAGRFVEEKGFDYLLRALPALAGAEPGVRLAFAGERHVGYERFYERCRPLLEAHADRIHFLGLLTDRRELARFYAACDAFALPSRTDCFASVQVEAMLCGTPVVSTDIPGARVAVLETGMGTVVRARDPAALAAGLLEVIRNRERYAAHAAEAREAFEPERLLDRYEALLRL
jgi:glycosyltransferase involved in cell wall biosynthesis